MPSQIQIIRLDASVPWRVFRSPESESWIGVCDPLGLTSQADTWNELFEMSAEMVQVLLQDLYAEGDLPAFLIRKGWQAVGPLPQGQTSVRFDVPLLMQESTAALNGLRQSAVQ
jgi:predicted RNase H-like HicB family nuclease